MENLKDSDPYLSYMEVVLDSFFFYNVLPPIGDAMIMGTARKLRLHNCSSYCIGIQSWERKDCIAHE